MLDAWLAKAPGAGGTWGNLLNSFASSSMTIPPEWRGILDVRFSVFNPIQMSHLCSVYQDTKVCSPSLSYATRKKQ